MKSRFWKDRIEYNSFAIVFVLFLYSFATLPGAFVSTGLAIIFLSLVVIAPDLWNNLSQNKRTVSKAVAIEFTLIVYLAIDMLIYPQYSSESSKILLGLCTIGSVGLLTGSMEYDIDSVLKYGKYMAILNFFTTSLFLIISNASFSLSMRFGYAMLPSALWFLYEVMKNKSYRFLPLFIVSTLMLTIWGSRGTLLVIGLFLFMTLLKYRKISWLLVAVFALVFVNQIQTIALNLCIFLSEMTGAHKITGLISILSGDLWSTTGGRDNLYGHCWDLFTSDPLGNGVCFWAFDSKMNYLYPHNIFLQVAAESGIIGLMLLGITLYTMARRLFMCERDYFMFYNMIFSISIARLLVSSNFWERPEFWLSIGIFIINPIIRYRTVING